MLTASIRRTPFAVPPVQYTANLAILLGAHLIAVQIRLKIPWGKPLGQEYDAQPFEFPVLLALATLGAYALSWLIGQSRPQLLNPRYQFRVLLVALALGLGGALLLLPDLSQLQLLYFAVTGFALGLGVIALPGRLTRRSGNDYPFFAHLLKLWRARFLLALWLRFNIQSRYSQTILGVLWIVLLPLSMSLVLAFAFAQILGFTLDVPFVVFMLAALVPWGLFNQGVQNSTHLLTNRMALLNQVYFPREILILLSLGEAFIDLLFTFASLLIVSALYGILPNPNFIYLPFLLLIMLCFTLGFMLFISCLSVLVRDIPQLVGISLQLLFYLTPILYPVEKIPAQFQVLVLLNPLASVINAIRSVIIYNQPPDILTLYYPFVVSLALLYLGYAFFKVNEERLTDFS